MGISPELEYYSALPGIRSAKIDTLRDNFLFTLAKHDDPFRPLHENERFPGVCVA